MPGQGQTRRQCGAIGLPVSNSSNGGRVGKRAEQEQNWHAFVLSAHFEKTECSGLLGRAWKMKGKMFELHCLLCIDDGFFIFTSRRDVVRASQVVHRTMARFRLMARIGRDGKLSKTKAARHPPLLQESRQRALWLMAV